MEDWPTGRIERPGPLVRRLLAPNPSPFTYTGTQTYIVGEGAVAVIDPGPDLPAHLDALARALAGERVAAILCTHTHRDHSPASRPLQAATGAPILGCAPLAIADDGPRADASFDEAYRPDRAMADGERLEGEGWTLEAVATPGHTSNHLCFALAEAKALFSGDHVMGWSTTVVAPPDGDMAAYMASLARLRARDDAILYPAHGAPVADPHARLDWLAEHRRARERQILACLAAGEGRIAAIVADLYQGVDPRLHPAAGRSVLGHLIDLEARGLARRAGDEWRPAS
ncbi:MAG TPA: MBL fold metallo-hydrolase [Allosphingosinicella sp.]|nr:MBL fold metallo-hydrolase [Allosphingosinicella sp.]